MEPNRDKNNRPGIFHFLYPRCFCPLSRISDSFIHTFHLNGCSRFQRRASRGRSLRRRLHQALRRSLPRKNAQSGATSQRESPKAETVERWYSEFRVFHVGCKLEELESEFALQEFVLLCSLLRRDNAACSAPRNLHLLD